MPKYVCGASTGKRARGAEAGTKQPRTPRVKRKDKQPEDRVIDVEARKERAKHIQPKGLNQSLYIDGLNTSIVTIGRGSAGTGKTYLAACVAANKLLLGEIDTIIITRPYVGMGRSSGFWPGDIKDKLEPYLMPIIDTLKKQLGAANFEALYGKSILIQPMESVRGQNWPNSYVIVDEAQNTTRGEARSLVTRIAEGTQIAFCGDDKQQDLKGISGITYLEEIIRKRNLKNCTVVNFTPKDNVRSGMSKVFVEIFEEEGALNE